MIQPQAYKLEFVLHSYSVNLEQLRGSFAEFARDINIIEQPCEKGKEFKVSLKAEDATAIFDICSQIGRIKTVKIDGG